jgi:hypothetical protein
MQNPVRRLCQPSALLGALAFSAIWLMTSGFDDDAARLISSVAVASWVAVSSGITGFVLLQIEQPAGGQRRRSGSRQRSV